MKNNTKVKVKSNNSKLKAQSLKRQVISRFQLLIIYINFMKKANKKVGDGGMFGGSTSKHFGEMMRGLKRVGRRISTSDVDRLGERAQSYSLKLKVVGVAMFAMMAVWVVMRANRAAFGCDMGTMN